MVIPIKHYGTIIRQSAAPGKAVIVADESEVALSSLFVNRTTVQLAPVRLPAQAFLWRGQQHSRTTSCPTKQMKPGEKQSATILNFQVLCVVADISLCIAVHKDISLAVGNFQMCIAWPDEERKPLSVNIWLNSSKNWHPYKIRKNEIKNVIHTETYFSTTD